MKERSLLTGLASTKKTYHIALEIERDQFPFKVGDSIGIIPQNDPEEVDAILKKARCLGTEEISHPKTSHRLTLLQLLSLHPLEDISHFTQLMPLLPRFYSIANSPRVFPDEIHLTVTYVTYSLNGQIRKGIGSFFLCNFAIPGVTPIPIYLQPSHHFSLPENPNASIILIGPGTGIAPFRAFLQERLATQSHGRNWPFFGERNRASDFYY